MEPLGISAASGLSVRPAAALPSDLSAVLREGTLVAGEVLQTLDGGTLLLGIGRHRVPAESHVELPPGQRFLFQVHESGAALELRILSKAGATESALMRALRAVAGQELPMARLLELLASSLRAELARSGALPAALRVVADSLPSRVFRPGSGAPSVRQLLDTSGARLEALLGDAAVRHASRADLRVLAQELRRAFFFALATLGEAASPGAPQSASAGALAEPLRVELTRLLQARDGDLAGALARWLDSANATGGVRDPLQLVRLALARALSDAQREAGLRAFDRSGLDSLGMEARRLLLRTLLGLPEHVPGKEARVESALAELGGDLKLQLLRAEEQLASTPAGPTREAVARALAALEAEQLLNVARDWSKAPLHWSLAVPDGDGWASAHLYFHKHGDMLHEREPDAQPSAVPTVQRLVLTVEFTRTGPLRAELALRSDALELRLSAAREAVVARLASALGELESRLSIGGRKVAISVGLAPHDELDAEAASHDIGFLREHRLMDVSG